MYRLLHDLRRSWRVVLPNLEQCGLLTIEYKHLVESIHDNSLWQPNDLLFAMTAEERQEFLHQIFDFFRKSYALSFSMLEPGVISSNAKKIKEKLKAPWTLDENEKLEVPSHIRLEKLSTSALNLYTESGGLLSVFGRYLRKKAAQHNIDISTQPTDKPGIPSAIKISGKTDDDTFIRNFKIIQEAYKRRILLQKAALGYKTEMGL